MDRAQQEERERVFTEKAVRKNNRLLRFIVQHLVLMVLFYFVRTHKRPTCLHLYSVPYNLPLTLQLITSPAAEDLNLALLDDKLISVGRSFNYVYLWEASILALLSSLLHSHNNIHTPSAVHPLRHLTILRSYVTGLYVRTHTHADVCINSQPIDFCVLSRSCLHPRNITERQCVAVTGCLCVLLL